MAQSLKHLDHYDDENYDDDDGDDDDGVVVVADDV
jgi:hypothetical protein